MSKALRDRKKRPIATLLAACAITGFPAGVRADTITYSGNPGALLVTAPTPTPVPQRSMPVADTRWVYKEGDLITKIGFRANLAMVSPDNVRKIGTDLDNYCTLLKRDCGGEVSVPVHATPNDLLRDRLNRVLLGTACDQVSNPNNVDADNIYKAGKILLAEVTALLPPVGKPMLARTPLHNLRKPRLGQARRTAALAR